MKPAHPQSKVTGVRSWFDRTPQWPLAITSLAVTLTAFLATACCVLPFFIIALGFGGGWLAYLDNGLLYRQELQGISGAVLLVGWGYLVIRRRRASGAVWITLIATLLLIFSFVIWDYQGGIRTWLMESR